MDGLKGYVALVSGLTEATAAKAREVATALLAQGGIQAVPSGAAAMATQITGLAEDLLVTARDNRGALLDVVRTEAERAVATLGVVTAAEADVLRGRIAELEAEIAQLRASAAATAGATATSRPTAPRTTATKATATKATATKATAKKVTAKKATAKKGAPRKATAPVTTPAKKPAASTAPATKATTSAATKAAPRKASAKKAAPRKAVAPTTTVADTTTSTGDESA